MLRNINTIQCVFAGKKMQKCVHVSQKNASESHKRLKPFIIINMFDEQVIPIKRV